MFIVGITGGIGSGKSAVTELLEQQGITIVDADIVARQVVEPGTPALKEIERHFGTSVINQEDGLDRQKLRAIVFDNPQERKWLEALLHPLIREEILLQLSQSNSHYTVLSSPLLLETDQHELVDKIVVVDVSENIQIQRTMKRDNNSSDQVKAIIAAQKNREERIQSAHYIINNDADLKALQEKVFNLHQQLLLNAKEQSHD
ncbi:MAG: dephospho-CoA kinase [Neptuniibacter sp.]